MTQEKNPPEKTNPTRLELILAAERMFALKGLRGATLREIREAAGQKNESVIHYYFGSREAIIEAILHLRSQPMNAMRLRMLAETRNKNNGLPMAAEQIVRCCLMPLVHYVLDGDKSGHYMRFLAQLRLDRAAWRKFSGLHDQGLNECLQEMKQAQPYLPGHILEQRFLSMMYMHLNGMAAIEQVQSERGKHFRANIGWVRVEDLISTSVALCEAPISPATVIAIQKTYP